MLYANMVLNDIRMEFQYLANEESNPNRLYCWNVATGLIEDKMGELIERLLET